MPEIYFVVNSLDISFQDTPQEYLDGMDDCRNKEVSFSRLLFDILVFVHELIEGDD